MAPQLLWQRDIASDLGDARNTFSSWDSCMSEAYCKWPAIIGIIVGSLIVISIIWCCVRCLCCGAECCCGCLSCFNRCCPSPRNKGYQQTPPQPYHQYQSPAPPMYGAGGMGYRGPQTATYDAHTKNEDALPAMPSWNTAASKHVEEDNYQMEKLNQQAAQQEGLLSNTRNSGGRYYNDGAQEKAGDLGTMQAGPYHNYDQHQQFVSSAVSTTQQSTYPPTYQTRPQSSVYENAYAPSIPPSYRTAAPSVMSPAQQQQIPGRKPVQGSWRDV